jgi:hypothetical protein
MHDSIDVTGRDFARSKKYRDVARAAQAAIVIDDLAGTDHRPLAAAWHRDPRQGRDRHRTPRADPHLPRPRHRLGTRRMIYTLNLIHDRNSHPSVGGDLSRLCGADHRRTPRRPNRTRSLLAGTRPSPGGLLQRRIGGRFCSTSIDAHARRDHAVTCSSSNQHVSHRSRPSSEPSKIATSPPSGSACGARNQLGHPLG